MDYPDCGPGLSHCHHHRDHHRVCLQTKNQVSLNWFCALQISKHGCVCVCMCLCVCVSWLLTDICRTSWLSQIKFISRPRHFQMAQIQTEKQGCDQKSSLFHCRSHVYVIQKQQSSHSGWEKTTNSSPYWGFLGAYCISTGKGRVWFSDCLHSVVSIYLQATTCY